jgi:hypothetical protein
MASPRPEIEDDLLRKVSESRLMLYEARQRVVARLAAQSGRPFDLDPIQDDGPIDVSRLASFQIPVSRVAVALSLDPALDLPCLPQM